MMPLGCIMGGRRLTEQQKWEIIQDYKNSPNDGYRAVAKRHGVSHDKVKKLVQSDFKPSPENLARTANANATKEMQHLQQGLINLPDTVTAVNTGLHLAISKAADDDARGYKDAVQGVSIIMEKLMLLEDRYMKKQEKNETFLNDEVDLSDLSEEQRQQLYQIVEVLNK